MAGETVSTFTLSSFEQADSCYTNLTAQIDNGEDLIEDRLTLWLWSQFRRISCSSHNNVSFQLHFTSHTRRVHRARGSPCHQPLSTRVVLGGCLHGGTLAGCKAFDSIPTSETDVRCGCVSTTDLYITDNGKVLPELTEQYQHSHPISTRWKCQSTLCTLGGGRPSNVLPTSCPDWSLAPISDSPINGSSHNTRRILDFLADHALDEGHLRIPIAFVRH